MNRPSSLYKSYIVISNNKKVADACPCVFIEGTPIEVLKRGLRYIREGGYGFYSHPFAGDARLLRNPFRTVVLERGGRENNISLDYFINALGPDFFDLSEYAAEDYRTIDYDLFAALQLIKEDCENAEVCSAR